jgi:tryptophan 2,3-dioxygenase
MALTYHSYLKLDEILSAQKPLSDGPEHDELLFIVIHQVYELWFKQVLHELKETQRLLEADDLHYALSRFKRILTILKTIVGQVDILETMTPLQFNSFRSRLESSSGFQSRQFRELEFRLGHRGQDRVNRYEEGSEERNQLQALLTTPSLYHSFLTFLNKRGFNIPDEILNRNLSLSTPSDERVRTALIQVYKTNAELSQLCERMIDLDEGIQEWRYRHVKMVERTIGMKQGTGGSAGVEYLKKTLFTHLFPDLWMIRNEF